MAINKKILIQFGKKVREERLKNGISQEKLGELAKVHRTYVGMIERAEKNITLTNMEKIAKALGKKLNDLIDF
ncbi:helix-turn-helix transcriptional regulator [Patescibacteria group bacterium]|nr:helix-turn-helix transcriptional regulator [Patescibacteria group bacterium]